MKLLTIILITGCFTLCSGQSNNYQYEPGKNNPYGSINPEAPKELADFAPLIGDSQCKSVTRTSQGGWADTVIVRWRFKYILNGLAVQDETLKADGKHTTSIRQYDPEAKKWYVTFFSSSPPFASPRTWEGGKVGDEIILYNEQTAPNGTEGFYKITFSDISNKNFNWLGEWVDKNEKFSYPTWYLFCVKK